MAWVENDWVLIYSLLVDWNIYIEVGLSFKFF